MLVRSDPDFAAGISTLGSTLRLVETDQDGNVVSDTTCTTSERDVTGTSDATQCLGNTFGDLIGIGAGDTLTVSQLSAAAGLQIDPTVRSIPPGPCEDFFGCQVDSLLFTDELDADPDADPDAMADVDRAAEATAVDVPVLDNDDLHGATSVQVSIATPPTNGTATVLDPATGVVRYVPDAGFTGQDTFVYQVQTEFGTSSATVTVTVDARPAPTPTHPHPPAPPRHPPRPPPLPRSPVRRSP